MCHRQWTRDLTICRSGVPARGKHPESSVPPKVFEAVGRHVGVPDRVLDVLVPEVVLQGPRVVAIVGELEPTGMAEPGLAALPSGTKTFNTRPGCADGEYGRRM